VRSYQFTSKSNLPGLHIAHAVTTTNSCCSNTWSVTTTIIGVVTRLHLSISNHPRDHLTLTTHLHKNFPDFNHALLSTGILHRSEPCTLYVLGPPFFQHHRTPLTANYAIMISTFNKPALNSRHYINLLHHVFTLKR
jgi:hypothetical protein